MKLHIFLDIDGCLINSKGEFTINPDLIKSKIRELEKKGFVCGINSNRGLNELLVFAKTIGANGPIISERGAQIYWGKKCRSKEFTQKIDFPMFNGKLVSIGNFKNDKHNKYSDGVFIDKERRYNLSLYCRKNGDCDFTKAEELVKELKKKFPKNKTYSTPKAQVWSFNDSINKGTALKGYKKNILPAKIAMIGHDSGDLEALKEADISLLTNNHSLDLEVDFIAKSSYTEGVLECLNYLLEEYNDY